MNYALIENGIVANIIYLHPMNAIDFPAAVPIGDYPATIGDAYADGAFYRNGEALKTATELKQAQLSAEMQAEMADMREALAELGVTVDE